MENLVTIRSYHDAVFAQLVYNTLVDSGVNTFLRSSNAIVVSDEQLIQVDSDDVDFALEVIEKLENY